MPNPGKPNPDLKERMELGKKLGKHVATKDELIKYKAEIGSKIIQQAKESGMTVEAFVERLPFFVFMRTIFTPDDFKRLKEASLENCINGNSHMAHQRMLEKMIEWAFSDPAKFGIEETAKTQPVTIIFDDDIKESDGR